MSSRLGVGKEKRKSGNQCGRSYHKHKNPGMKSFTVAVRKGSMQVKHASHYVIVVDTVKRKIDSSVQ